MTDEKMKVKDLAGELGLQNKDVLAAAKEMGISAAKVAASSLSESEAARLRAHFAPEPEKREDVIVRRRRKTAEDEAPVAQPPVVEAAPQAAPAAETPAEEAPAAETNGDEA